jgi:hypothetical protein
VKAVGVVEASMSRIAYVLMDVKTTKEKVFYYPAFTIIKKQFPRIK